MTLFRGGYVARLSTGDLRADVLHGHEWLVRGAGQDLGFDPSVWHEHLRASDAGGYRWSNKHLGFPRRIREARNNPAWLRVIDDLRADRVDGGT
jgi:hypothetical protein